MDNPENNETVARNPIGQAKYAVGIFVFLFVHWLAGAEKTEPHASPTQQLDPAAWGDGHVEKQFPEYMTGDECLFCHRDIGTTWQENRHQTTIRPVSVDSPVAADYQAVAALRALADGKSFADGTSHLMGNANVIRFLKRSEAYGKFEILMTKYNEKPAKPSPEKMAAAGTFTKTNELQWDAETFGNRCAGCHTTAVDMVTTAFSSVSLDCFVCHGDVDLAHTKTPGKALLSTVNQQPRQVISICGQCHLRGAKSKSSGRPYPNTYVAGDNLFRDFQADLSDAAIEQLPIGEQHILQNIRDVVIFGQSDTTCLSCHAIHGQNSEQHQSLANSAICSSCHAPDSGGELRQTYLLSRDRIEQNTTCDY